MSAHRIASRYAKSILDLAIERSDLDRVLDDMKYVLGALKSRDFYLLVKSPIVSPSKKQAIFHKLFSSKLAKTTTSFFDIMIRKGRENLLPEIAESFVDQYKEKKGILTVLLKTAAPLDESTLDSIRQKIVQSDFAEQQLELEVQVDPNLIGGFALEFGGREYNSSIAHSLQELRKQFLN